MNSPGVEFLKISNFRNIIISKMATNKNKLKTKLFYLLRFIWDGFVSLPQNEV